MGALMPTTLRGCGLCGVGRVLVHLRHLEMALGTMAGRRPQRQAGIGPENDGQRQQQRQASPHCAPRNHADFILAFDVPIVCDRGHSSPV